MKKNLTKVVPLLMILAFVASCGQSQKGKTEKAKKEESTSTETNIKNDKFMTQAEKLGYGKDKKVLIIHADDAGMCTEANRAIEEYLTKGDIKSTSVMMPCPAAEEMIAWTVAHPKYDVGIHLTLTSEWKTYRWGPMSDPAKVPGLIDPDGKFWHEVPGVAKHASAQEVETEIRAQIEKSISLGWKPTHMDSHMGTLFARPDYLNVYLKVSEDYGIPAAVINFATDEVIEIYKDQGYPITDEVVDLVKAYKMPKLDFYTSVPKGATYDEMKENFFKMVNSLKPGLVQVFFHPSVFSERLKTITNSWQRRVWEVQLMSDPEVKKFFKDNGIIIASWKDVMEKYEKVKVKS